MMLSSLNILLNGELRQKGHILGDGSVIVKHILAKINWARALCHGFNFDNIYEHSRSITASKSLANKN
jgi:hypothetical protein